MPRKSSEALAGEAFRRLNAPPAPPPEPPECLSPAAADCWRNIVADLPHDYFRPPNDILLEMLCNTCVSADAIAAEIAKITDLSDPKQLRLFSRLSIMAARQGKMIAMLCTKLRLLPRAMPSVHGVTA
jgi:phage terminase small subunit